jgi:hypothetical protein
MNRYLILILFSISSFSQVTKDLDGDKIMDKVYYDSASSIIVCKLSTNKFKAIKSKANLSDEEQCGVRTTKNGFEFFIDYMRAGFAHQFRYDIKSKKIQLIGMSRYEYGPASNDGSGKSSVNLLTNNYIGEWYHYDLNKDKLIKMEVIKTKMIFQKMYLENYDGGYQSIYEEKCVQMYRKMKKKYQ